MERHTYIEEAVLDPVRTHKLLLYEQFSTYINHLCTILKKKAQNSPENMKNGKKSKFGFLAPAL